MIYRLGCSASWSFDVRPNLENGRLWAFFVNALFPRSPAKNAPCWQELSVRLPFLIPQTSFHPSPPYNGRGHIEIH
jgi:hypothetical protein